MVCTGATFAEAAARVAALGRFARPYARDAREQLAELVAMSMWLRLAAAGAKPSSAVPERIYQDAAYPAADRPCVVLAQAGMQIAELNAYLELIPQDIAA